MLEILFEDEWLLAVDKPPGVVVHPTYRNQFGTLLDQLRARDAGVSLSVVSRLDKLTSGIVLLAKSAEVHAAVQRAWPVVEKDYRAVVEGRAEERGRIALPLGTDPEDRRRRIVTPLGAASVTEFERLAYCASHDRSVLRCRPLTGRRHQIRIHLAARGWPITGDALYGMPLDGFPRHALHAWRLALTHPVTAARLDLRSAVPRQIVALTCACSIADAS